MRTALAVAATLALLLTGCSSEQEPGSSASPAPGGSETTTPADEPTANQGGRKPLPSDVPDDAVEIEIEGDRVEPNGKQVAVTAGEPLTLAITSDRATELHVHSSPEQMVEVTPGESTVRLTVDTPGVVDVEEHESGVVVLRLEVR